MMLTLSDSKLAEVRAALAERGLIEVEGIAHGWAFSITPKCDVPFTVAWAIARCHDRCGFLPSVFSIVGGRDVVLGGGAS